MERSTVNGMPLGPFSQAEPGFLFVWPGHGTNPPGFTGASTWKHPPNECAHANTEILFIDKMLGCACGCASHWLVRVTILPPKLSAQPATLQRSIHED